MDELTGPATKAPAVGDDLGESGAELTATDDGLGQITDPSLGDHGHRLAVENYSLLLGETAPAHVRRTIERVLGDDRAVRAVRDLRTMHLGPRSLLIVASVELVPGLETASIEATVTRLRSRLTEVLGEVTNPHLIVIEPGASVPGVRRPGDSRRRAAGSTAGS